MLLLLQWSSYIIRLQICCTLQIWSSQMVTACFIGSWNHPACCESGLSQMWDCRSTNITTIPDNDIACMHVRREFIDQLLRAFRLQLPLLLADCTLELQIIHALLQICALTSVRLQISHPLRPTGRFCKHVSVRIGDVLVHFRLDGPVLLVELALRALLSNQCCRLVIRALMISYPSVPYGWWGATRVHFCFEVENWAPLWHGCLLTYRMYQKSVPVGQQKNLGSGLGS